MSPSFEPIYSLQGFDRAAGWQMVALGGTRYVALRNGSGLTVTSSTPTVRVDEISRSELPPDRATLQSKDRVFRLTGQSRGTATLQAKGNAGMVITGVLMDVFPKKSLLVSFNFVADTGGHTTLRANTSAPSWINGINRIFNGQANIFVTLLRCRPVTIPEDLGTRINWPAKGDPKLELFYNRFVNREDPDADVSINLVWSLEVEGTSGDVDGVQSGRVILVEDHASDVATTMAHELGHYFGADHFGGAHDTHHLMHPYTNGRHLPRDMVKLFHETIIAR